MSEFIVTGKAQRPANMNGKCFYCNQEIGSTHKDDCGLINKKAIIRVNIEYEIEVPASWNKEDVEFHRNEGSWCANNVITELEELFKGEEKSCMCECATFEVLSISNNNYLKE